MTPQNTNYTTKLKTFVYLRRSQDREDRQSLSIDKQDAQLRSVIQRNDIEPIYLPPEERTAKYPGRPIFNDMMERVENGEARYIAVWALSRLSRNPIDGGRVIYALDTGKLLAIHTPSRVYRNTPDDKMVLAIELALAKKNNDDLSVQVKEGFEAKRTHGQYPGPAPIGYLNTIIRPGERNIIPDPDKGPKIVRLFEMAATGLYTPQDIWQEAQDIALHSRSGIVLGKQTIIEVLKRRAYTGVFKYGGEEWHQGSYKPLITVELFDKVQLAMGWVKSPNSERTATTSGRHYTYKGLLLCKKCRFNVTAYTKSKKLADGLVAEYLFYTCTKKNKKIKCDEPQLSSSLVEQEVKSRMQEYEISEVDGAECNSWLERYYSDYINSKNRYKPDWLRNKKEAQKALDTLDEKLERGIIADERYKLRAAKHEAILARTTELLDGADTNAERWLELAKETFATVTNIGDVFEMANDDERRRLMMFVGSNWYLGNKKVDLTPRRPIDLLRHTDKNTVWRARPDLNRRSPP
jgi:site-specific DNA recombinase